MLRKNKIEVVDYVEIDGEIVHLDKLNLKQSISVALPVATAIGALTVPELASANEGFPEIHGAVMRVFDYGVVLIIVFAGASWALGHRTKAIEILIGVCCGYLLARKAIDIRDFLRSI